MTDSGTRDTAALVDRFRSSLDALDVESTVVDRASLTTTLEDRIEPPVVGAPLGDLGPLPEAVTVRPSFEDLRRARTGVTGAALGVASHGSVAVPSTSDLDGPVSLYPERHVAVVAATDLVPDLGTALAALSEEFEAGTNDVVFVTGPSSTGDMGELVVGVHGPAEMEVLVVE